MHIQISDKADFKTKQNNSEKILAKTKQKGKNEPTQM